MKRGNDSSDRLMAQFQDYRRSREGERERKRSFVYTRRELSVYM